jgi:CTP:molybdopterin cytidylyltransferase MocA
MKACAVIPAAGRGTRLGADGPKILTPLTATDTIWSILHAKLAPLVDNIHLVLSPDGASAFPALPANVSTSIQPEPTGMGDAIFRGHDVWSRYDAVLIVWGDQVFVSADTLGRALAALETPERHAVLPVTRMAAPYVEYVFDGEKLSKVLQTREGDATTLFRCRHFFTGYPRPQARLGQLSFQCATRQRHGGDQLPAFSALPVGAGLDDHSAGGGPRHRSARHQHKRRSRLLPKPV